MLIERVNLVNRSIQNLSTPSQLPQFTITGAIIVQNNELKRAFSGKFYALKPAKLFENLGPGTYSFEVPAGVSSLFYDLRGAGGGGGGLGRGSPYVHHSRNGGRGGNGARLTGTIAVTPLETLTIEIGDRGQAGLNQLTEGLPGTAGTSTRILRGDTVLLDATGGGGGQAGIRSGASGSPGGAPGADGEPEGGATGGNGGYWPGSGTTTFEPTAGADGSALLSAYI